MRPVKERVLFIGTRFSNLYTSVDIWPCCREDQPGPLCGALCGVSRRRRCVNRLLPPAILSRHQSTRRRYLLRCLRMQTDPIVLGLLGATRIKSVRTRFIQFGFVQFRSALCDPRSSSTLMIRQTSVPMSSGWRTFLEARTWICCKFRSAVLSRPFSRNARAEERKQYAAVYLIWPVYSWPNMPPIGLVDRTLISLLWSVAPQ